MEKWIEKAIIFFFWVGGGGGVLLKEAFSVLETISVPHHTNGCLESWSQFCFKMTI